MGNRSFPMSTMRSHLRLIFSLLLFIFPDATLPSPGTAGAAESCRPFNCGSDNASEMIRYPFWLATNYESDHQAELLPASYCGYPELKLHCKDRGPILFHSDGDYVVTKINYTSRSFSLISTDFFLDWAGSCLRPLRNFTVGSNLSKAPADSTLTFFFNCSDELIDDVIYQEALIPCLTNGSEGSYVFMGDEIPNNFTRGACEEIVAVPAVIRGGPETMNISELAEELDGILQRGFDLLWAPAAGGDDQCRSCEETQGKCWYGVGGFGERSFACFCGVELHESHCNDGAGGTKKAHKSKTGVIIGVSIAGGLILAAIFSFLCFFLFIRWRKKKRSSSNLLDRIVSFQPSSKFDSELGSSVYTPIFTYDELVEATNGFDASKELGDGGFGTVYKGKLRDGRVVAVKRLYENNYRRVEQFMNEVKILSLLRHQNLVTLYGCTSRHSRELLLVYEFVPNGTVADHLHGSRSSESFIPWLIRMTIAIETADALNYLHSVEPQIIHRDVKSCNILLDNGFHVKVGDFGLSRLFPMDATHVSTAPQGTPGYVDPEYHQCYQLTDKSDVYSFGVVLMELISSKPAVDITRRRNEINLATMAITKIKNRELNDFVDPRLGSHSDDGINRMINQVAELAFRCLHSEKEMRPSIKEVLDVLGGIESGALKNGCGREDGDVFTVKEEARLLKNIQPFSPNSVTEVWDSRLTTPNTSG